MLASYLRLLLPIVNCRTFSLLHGIFYLFGSIFFLMPLSQVALATQDVHQTIIIKKGDSLYRIFKTHKIPQKGLQAILALGSEVSPLKSLGMGKQLTLTMNTQHALTLLSYQATPQDTLTVRLDDKNHFLASTEHVSLPSQLKTIAGTFHHSLYQDTVTAGLPIKLVQPLADLFTWKVSLAKSLREGDTFKIIFEQSTDDKHTSGAIVAAEIMHRGQSLQAFCYQKNSDENRHCYGPKGESLTPVFSRYPVAYTHISDRFNTKRKHPILHVIRPHWGVDFAAKKGTPIHATADGTITYMARKGGFGRFIEIDHHQGVVTRYAHLSRFHKNLKKGVKIKRDQVIGYVGKSGLSTGSHLHYEVRIHGKAKNPLTVTLPQGKSLSHKEMTAFLAFKDKIWQS